MAETEQLPKSCEANEHACRQQRFCDVRDYGETPYWYLLIDWLVRVFVFLVIDFSLLILAFE